MSALDIGQVGDDVALRVAFLHTPSAGGGRGPLAEFVRGRRHAALDLLLLAHAVASNSDSGWIAASGTEWAAGIARGSRPGDRATISRSWTWLEEQQLVRTTSRGRIRLVQVRCEDGSGRPWTFPGVASPSIPFFKVPRAYWMGGFAHDLGLAAKAMLLIGLSLQRQPEKAGEIKGSFEFPLERASGWYGLTSTSASAGLRQLRESGLLRMWSVSRERTDGVEGVTHDRRYSLNRLEDVAYRRARRAEPAGLQEQS